MKNQDIFPDILGVQIESKIKNTDFRSVFHERILYRYLSLKLSGWSVSDFLKKEGIEHYVLYAVTDFTGLFIEDLKQNSCEDKLDIICDKNAQAFPNGYKGRTVINQDELIRLYKNGKKSKVIIMSVMHENEIFSELLSKGIRLDDIIPFVGMLW